MSLFSKKQAIFGLDVGGGSFKILELAANGKKLFIKAYSDGVLPKGLLINDQVADGKTFQYMLKQSLDKPQFGRISTNHVVASLPESRSFVRVIQIPVMSESEAESAVPFEAENFIPMPVDQVYLDWQILGTVEDKINVLIIASPKELVDKYLEVLDSCGLKTVGFEVESQSCLRAVLPPSSKETALVLDLDAYRSSLIMIEDGHLQFTSTVPIAGNTFTESIARSLGVSSAKAEEIKKRVGIANTADYPNIKTALLPILNNFVDEIKNILRFHRDHSGKEVSKILLVGGTAKLKNLPEYLAPQVMEFGNLKVELANPWQNLSGLTNIPMDQFESLGYVTALGLAMRNLNEK